MVIIIASSAIDRVYETGWGQTKDDTIDMCSFSAKHATFMEKRAKTCCLAITIISPTGRHVYPFIVVSVS
jgi:hypothetical protein